MDLPFVFKKTLSEFITEIFDILKSGRYDVPHIIESDLKVAQIAVAASNEEIITEIMQTFGKFVIQFEKEVVDKNVVFFDKLDICKGCAGKKGAPCICSPVCGKKCACTAKCPNCSELLNSLDSATFSAVKYIISQAVTANDADKKEDIDVIFGYISSLLAAAKSYKKR